MKESLTNTLRSLNSTCYSHFKTRTLRLGRTEGKHSFSGRTLHLRKQIWSSGFLTTLFKELSLKIETSKWVVLRFWRATALVSKSTKLRASRLRSKPSSLKSQIWEEITVKLEVRLTLNLRKANLINQLLLQRTKERMECSLHPISRLCLKVLSFQASKTSFKV
jgi:hypothetical protein